MIGLVSCSAQKLDRRAPARELYTSPLFRKSLRHALQRCDLVYILSAKHGLVELDQELEPYDQRMAARKADRVLWGQRVVARLQELHGTPSVLYILAGQEYAVPVIGAASHWWQDWRRHVLQPLAGRPMGERLRWLNSNVLPYRPES